MVVEQPAAEECTAVPLKICRGGKVQALQVRLAQEDGLGTCRLVHWCGAQLQVWAAPVSCDQTALESFRARSR
jgi:hypothetical protein